LFVVLGWRGGRGGFGTGVFAGAASAAPGLVANNAVGHFP